MNGYWPESSNGIIVKISVIWSRCFFANCWNKDCADPYPKCSTSYRGSGWQDTLFLLEKMTWWQGRGCLNTCQKFDATRPKPAHGRYGLGWDRGARTQLKVLIFRYRHFFVTYVRPQLTSRTQLEKELIVCYQHFILLTGAPTDLQAWESAHFLLETLFRYLRGFPTDLLDV